MIVWKRSLNPDKKRNPQPSPTVMLQIRALYRGFFWFFEIVGVGVLGLILYDTFTNSPWTGNIETWTIAGAPDGWHVVSILGLVVLAVVVGWRKRSIFTGGLSAFFTLSIHETLYLAFLYLYFVVSGNSSQLVVHLTGAFDIPYLVFITPMLVIFPWLFIKVKWRIAVLPTLVIDIVWLVGALYYQSTLVTPLVWLELLVWVVTPVSVYLSLDDKSCDDAITHA